MNTRYASRNSGRSRVSVLSHLMQAWKVTAPSTRGFAAAAFVAILGKHSLAGAGRASLLLLVGSLFLAGTVPSAQAEQPSVVSPAAAPAFSLDDCLRESLTANHALLARSLEANAALARRRGAGAARLPRFGVQASAQYATDPLRVRPATANGEAGVYSNEVWQASVGASLPLFTGGRLVAEQEAARLLAEAAQADLAHSRQALAVRVVALFQEALALRSVVTSLEQSQLALNTQLERIDALLRQQKAAEVDRLRVSVRLARVEQSAIEARSRLEVVHATLAVLMGRNPERPVSLAGELVAPTAPTDIADGVGERGDELAARARATAAERQARAARAAWYPSLDAVAGWGPRSDFAGSARYEAGFAGAQLSWNLWDFGRTQSRIAEAKATARARAELSAETSLQRRLEFTAADSAVRSAEARIAASRLAVEQARESLRIEQSKYDLGRGAIVDVLDAQSAAVEAEALRARALADYAVAAAGRDFAAGRIFTPAAVLPALRADPSTSSVSTSTVLRQ